MSGVEDYSADWKCYFNRCIKKSDESPKPVSLVSWIADFVLIFGLLIFGCELYSWLRFGEWNAFPAVLLLNILPSSLVPTFANCGDLEKLVLYLLRQIDISVIFVLGGYSIARFFEDRQ